MSQVFFDVGISTPVRPGKGVRLFDHVDIKKFSFQIFDVIDSEDVTNLNYKILKKNLRD